MPSLADGSHGNDLGALALLGCAASPSLRRLSPPLLLLGEDNLHHLALVCQLLALHLEQGGLGRELLKLGRVGGRCAAVAGSVVLVRLRREEKILIGKVR